VDWRDVRRRLSPAARINADVRDEIAFHIEGRVRELVERGWHEEEARAHVLRRFGDVASVERRCREYDAQRIERETWRSMMEGWIRDVRFALRGVRRNPGFAAVVVVTLALGIGASTAVFSVVEGIMLRPPPFFDPDRLAVVWQNDRATGTVREDASPADYFDYVERSRTFSALGLVASGTVVLTRPDAEPLRLAAAAVTQNLPSVLGISMQLGRGFTPGEDVPGGRGVTILSDRFWRNTLAADPSVIGRVVTIDGEPTEVVGVLEAGIDFPSKATDVWMPIRQTPAVATRQSHWVQVVGRLEDGTTLASAQAEMTSIMAALEQEYPDANTNRGAFVERMSDVGRGEVRLTLWVLLGAVLSVFLIACVNVANLLLARGAARAHELAVLGALGARRGQIRRRFLAEGLIFATLSCGLGVALAAGGIRVLLAMAPAELLALGEPRLNLTVLGFAVVAGALVGLGFALLPTLQHAGGDLRAPLKDGRTADSSVRMPIRRVLVAAQLGLAVVLLVGAGLLADTLRNLHAVDPGFRPDHLLRVSFALPASRYPSMATWPDWPEIHRFNGSVVDEVAALPGVRSAALTLNHPLDPGWTNSFRIEGRPYDPDQGEMTTRLVSPSYFATVGIQLVDGRFLGEGDDLDGEPVLVLNREAAQRYFPDGDALGSRIRFWGATFRRVVGIVENERIHGLVADAPPTMYLSLSQAPQRGGTVTLLVATVVPPLSLVGGVRRTIASLDQEVPIYDVTTMAATVREASARERFASLVLGVFAGVAVFLAMLGVHGVLAYLVAQRGREVGVRMALGATRSDVVRMIVGQGALMAGLGLALGLGGALALARLLRGLLFGVSASDPGVYAAVVTGLVLVSLTATALPARRAARIDPAASLRGE
jgi:putative ABC transport system permease protein